MRHVSGDFVKSIITAHRSLPYDEWKEICRTSDLVHVYNHLRLDEFTMDILDGLKISKFNVLDGPAHFRETLIVLHDVSSKSSWLELAPIFFEAHRLCNVDVLTVYVEDSRSWPLPFVFEQAVPKLIDFFHISRWRLFGFGYGAGILLSVLLRLPERTLRSSYSGICVFVDLKNHTTTEVNLSKFLNQYKFVQICSLSTASTHPLSVHPQILNFRLPSDAYVARFPVFKFNPKFFDSLLTLFRADSILQLVPRVYLEFADPEHDVDIALLAIPHCS